MRPDGKLMPAAGATCLAIDQCTRGPSHVGFEIGSIFCPRYAAPAANGFVTTRSGSECS